MSLYDRNSKQLYLTALEPHEIHARVQRIREIYKNNDFHTIHSQEIDPSLLCPDCGGNKLPSAFRCFLCFRGDKTTPRPNLKTAHPCLVCGGVVHGKNAKMCKLCHLISWRVVNEEHINPRQICPDCGGKKSRKGFRCRRCDWKSRGIQVVSVSGRYTSDRKVCKGCGKFKTRPDSTYCKGCYVDVLKPPGYESDGYCKDCRKKVKNRAVRCRNCKDRVISSAQR